MKKIDQKVGKQGFKQSTSFTHDADNLEVEHVKHFKDSEDQNKLEKKVQVKQHLLDAIDLSIQEKIDRNIEKTIKQKIKNEFESLGREIDEKIHDSTRDVLKENRNWLDEEIYKINKDIDKLYSDNDKTYKEVDQLYEDIDKLFREINRLDKNVDLDLQAIKKNERALEELEHSAKNDINQMYERLQKLERISQYTMKLAKELNERMNEKLDKKNEEQLIEKIKELLCKQEDCEVNFEKKINDLGEKFDQQIDKKLIEKIKEIFHQEESNTKDAKTTEKADEENEAEPEKKVKVFKDIDKPSDVVQDESDELLSKILNELDKKI